MDYRKLGRSDLEVSAISLGSWLTYSGGVGRETAEACMKAAFDVGITLFDTANAYGKGAAEQAWGEILAPYARESYVLATKVYFPMSETDRGLSAEQIHRQLDASLARLKTDYIDLYQCHRFDVDVPIEETMEALTDVVASGKVRHIGFSEWTPEQIRAATAVEGVARFTASQPQYSMLWRAPEAELFALCDELGIGHIVFSPLAQGLLTGKYRPGAPLPADSRAANDEMNGFIGRRMTDEVLRAVARLAPIAEQAGLPVSQMALAWILRRPEVGSAIIGASRPAQIHANAQGAGTVLDADLLAAIDAALGDVPQREPALAGDAREGVCHR